jgi:hypothetical protein
MKFSRASVVSTKPCGLQEVEAFAAHELAAQPVPFAHVQGVRALARRLGLDRRAGDDGQLVVRLRHVEVIDRVAEAVGVGEHLRGRLDLQLEADQPLARGLLGLHPQLHDAFADGRS